MAIKESELIAIVKKGDEFMNIQTGEMFSAERVNVLNHPPMILEIGENYTPGAGFSALGKIPEGARGMLLENDKGFSYRDGPIELIASSYCEINDLD